MGLCQASLKPCSSYLLVDKGNSAQSTWQNSLVSARTLVAAWASVAWVSWQLSCLESIQSSLPNQVVWGRPFGRSLRTTSRGSASCPSWHPPFSVRLCPQQMVEKRVHFCPSQEEHVGSMLLRWGTWTCCNHVDCLKARWWPSCPRGRFLRLRHNKHRLRQG